MKNEEVRKLVKEKDYAAALKILDNEKSSITNKSDFFVSKGNIYLLMNDLWNANENYQDALKVDPKNYDAEGGRTICTINNRLPREELLKNIQNKKTVNCYLARALDKRERCQYVEGFRELQSAHKDFPESELIMYEMIQMAMLASPDDSNIDSWINEYKTSYEEDQDILLLEMKHLYQTSQFDECRKICNKVLRKYPRSEIVTEARNMIRKLKNNDIEDNKSKKMQKARLGSDNNSNEKTVESLDADEAFKQLDELIGLKEVKEEIHKIGAKIKYDQTRRKMLGIPDEKSNDNYSFIFVGNPGTGKTTVARLLGAIFKSYNIIEKGQLVECSRGDLIGQFQGQTAIKVQEAFKKAIGGVLFIDEAYSLCRDQFDTFGHEAVDAIVKEMEDHRNELVVILAGYKKEMTNFIRTNSGLESRFRKIINFPDYTDDELLQIAGLMAHKQKYEFTDESKAAFLQAINKKRVDSKFGNAREVRNLMADAIENKAYHYNPERDGKEYFVTLKPKDFGIDITLSPETRVKEYLDELNSLTGLRNVKREIEELLSVAEYQNKSEQTGKNPNQNLSMNLNLFFLGSPGTGKTTVARIYSKILAAMGILKKGHMVEVTRSDLVGQYVGHTAKKTREKCEDAYGGILFIDEAYSLYNSSNGGEDTFGLEAIAELIKQMEDNRDKLVVIMAGYTKEMEEFKKANSGIASRISKNIIFEDYNEDELLQILNGMLKKRNISPIDEATEVQLKQSIHNIYENRTVNFGNGRTMRNFEEQIFRNLAVRVQREQIDDDKRNKFTAEDVINAQRSLSY